MGTCRGFLGSSRWVLQVFHRILGAIFADTRPVDRLVLCPPYTLLWRIRNTSGGGSTGVWRAIHRCPQKRTSTGGRPIGPFSWRQRNSTSATKRSEYATGANIVPPIHARNQWHGACNVIGQEQRPVVGGLVQHGAECAALTGASNERASSLGPPDAFADSATLPIQ